MDEGGGQRRSNDAVVRIYLFAFSHMSRLGLFRPCSPGGASLSF